MTLKEDFYCLHFPREKGIPSSLQGHMGKHQGPARRQKGAKESIGHSVYCVFHKVKQGRGNSIALTSLNNVGGLYAIGVVSSCLVPGPG